MRLVLRTISVLVLIAFPALVVVLILDTYGILRNPEEYRLVQQFVEADLTWDSPSILKYVAQNLGAISVLLGLAFLSVQYLRNRLRPVTTRIYGTVLFFVIVIIILGYIQWVETGFDH